MQGNNLSVIVTDAEYKQSICIIKDIHEKFPQYKVFGLVKNSSKVKFLPSKKICTPLVGALKDYLDNDNFDLIIGVGASSVKTLVESKYTKSLLPQYNQFMESINKRNLSSFIKGSDFVYPQTYNLSMLDIGDLSFPLILKSLDETLHKEDTIYINTTYDLEHQLSLIKDPDNFILQEKAIGIPVGYFAIFYKGECIIDYMHKRIREIPFTGGSSTASKIYSDSELQHSCREFLKRKEWNGPVMLEFLVSKDSYTLIEINPKFWGSFELSYAAGLSFTSAYISSFLGEPIKNKKLPIKRSVYWPFDGDLVTIFKTKQFRSLKDYFKEDSYVVTGENVFIVFYKILWTIKKIFYK